MSLQLGEGAGPLEVSVSPLHHAPVGVDEADGGPTRIVRSLCRYTTADGRRGAGWTEWNHVEIPRKKENLL